MQSWFKNIAADLLQRSETKQSRVSPLIAYSSLGKPVWTPKRYDKLAEEGFAKNVIVYRSVNLIAQGAASVPWRLYKGDEQIYEHPVLDLLRHPSPTQGGAAFIEAVLAFKLLAGNSYIEAVRDACGFPVELYALHPENWTVE